MEDEQEQPETDIKEKEKQPVPKILYCGVCGLPPEYCEYGPSFDKCKPWLIEHCPGLYPNLQEEEKKEGEETEQKESKGKRGGKGLNKPDTDAEVKLMPGGKLKKKEVPTIHVSLVQRNKRKYVTVVCGLEKFGVKLPEAAKLMAKKFSCGASVVKGTAGEEEIDVQGDITDDLIDFLNEKWQISDDAIFTDDKARKRG